MYLCSPSITVPAGQLLLACQARILTRVLWLIQSRLEIWGVLHTLLAREGAYGMFIIGEGRRSG